MIKTFFATSTFIFLLNFSCQAQGPATGPPDPVMVSMSIEVAKISRSVTSLSDHLKDLVGKLDKGAAGSSVATEKHERLAAGLQLLANAEQLLIVRQRFQIELVEKQGSTRSRLAQVERDIMPQNIDRSVQYEGTTKTEELRDNRRSALMAERTSLQSVLAQVTSTLADTNESVKEAQSLVLRLRRQYLPELEKELER